jgi:hypothetical protein
MRASGTLSASRLSDESSGILKACNFIIECRNDLLAIHPSNRSSLGVT